MLSVAYIRSNRIVDSKTFIYHKIFMMTLKDFLKLEELEKEFFGYVFDNPDFIIELIDIDCCAPIYDNYKEIIYQDIIQETLNKTYDFSKFKSYLLKEFGKENEFKTDIEIIRNL